MTEQEQHIEAVLLIERSMDCFEIVMEKDSVNESYVYHTSHSSYDWIEETAKSLAEIYNVSFVNLARIKQEVGNRIRRFAKS